MENENDVAMSWMLQRYVAKTVFLPNEEKKTICHRVTSRKLSWALFAQEAKGERQAFSVGHGAA